MVKLKRKLCLLLSILTLVSMTGCAEKNADLTQQEETTASQVQQETSAASAPEQSGNITSVSDIKSTDDVKAFVAQMKLEDKASQMVQGAGYNIDQSQMEDYCYGSVLSTWQGMDSTFTGWKKLTMGLQQAALDSEVGIPYIYGTDAVHGVNQCQDSVIFPHNIGIGAANDEELTYKMGEIVADEMKLTGMLINFSPCVAVAQDPRWGRTYESYSSDPMLVMKLGTVYTKGLADNGILVCAKHFVGDGNVKFGTGEGDFLIDRGDAELTKEELQELLNVYQSLIDAGAKSIMISHSSVNGVKMHADKELITDVLKGEMGFDGMVLSDWESIHNIPGDSLKDQVITSINAGIDMLMEPEAYAECSSYIIEAVNEGTISMERVDDAVTRILTAKFETGIFADPLQENLKTNASAVGSEEYRDVARQLVEKSLVLLKNDKEILPIKAGSKIFVTGPAANDSGVQCGGWTISWSGSTDENCKFIPAAKTILDGLNEIASEYNLTIITDETKASEADMTILCIGETPYAEWNGDTEDLSITGATSLEGNAKAIELAESLGKPTVALIVAGRNVIIEDYASNWDAVVMCYLPGSEADGVANVLTGKSKFEGKLPMPWYKSVEDIDTDTYLYNVGYGMKY